MGHNNTIRVLIAHNDPIACAGLSATFGKFPDIEVVNLDDETGVAASGWRRQLGLAADVVVADYENGFELAANGSTGTETGELLKIMIVATAARECEIRSAFELGVRGYVLAGCKLEELACGVRSVHHGLRHLSAPVAQKLAESLSGGSLTVREQEVLKLVVDGLGNKSIAKRLDIAVGTVKSHLKGAFDKLGVHSRTQAICAVERRGLLRGQSELARHTRETSEIAATPSYPGSTRANCTEPQSAAS